MYSTENYRENVRFNNQYHEICRFLKTYAGTGYNEHFHWGRFDWMMAHPNLNVEMLPENALFRDERGALAGAALYDTSFDDRWYILHSTSDERLLRQMIEYVTETDADAAVVKANLNDTALCSLLETEGFEMQCSESVLQIDLSCSLSFRLPQGFYLNIPNAEIDSRQWRLVIYRGFDHEGIPQEPRGEAAKVEKHLERSEYIRMFAIKDGEYAAHCGVWYSGGETAYIEPVATIPEHRGRGLGRAVVYAAINCAKERGAKRAIVLSDQEFYFHIGMRKSSEVAAWAKKGG